MTARIKPRTILHIDINSCFASCEQQDARELRGRPLGVVQDSGKRSVIIGSSREAKMIGVGTGMPIWEAKKIFADITTVPAHFDRYVFYSRAFGKIWKYYSNRVEVFSIDELFIDVTSHENKFSAIAKEIKARLKVEMGSWFTVSVGIAPNKMLAKLASGSQKPDGLVVVDPKKRLEFLDKHPLWHICGIGFRVERRLNRLGIYTIPQLRQAPKKVLTQEFGVMGEVYSQWGHGIDPSPVLTKGKVAPEKSFGNQVTLPRDLNRPSEINRVFLNLCWQVAGRMREKGMGARSVLLTLRSGGQSIPPGRWTLEDTFTFKRIRRKWLQQQYTPGKVCATAYDLYRTVKTIYKKLAWRGSVRFVGISAGNLIPLNHIPLSLFNKDIKREKTAFAWDKVRKKYEPFLLRPASLLAGRVKDSNLNGFSKRF